MGYKIKSTGVLPVYLKNENGEHLEYPKHEVYRVHWNLVSLGGEPKASNLALLSSFGMMGPHTIGGAYNGLDSNQTVVIGREDAKLAALGGLIGVRPRADGKFRLRARCYKPDSTELTHLEQLIDFEVDMVPDEVSHEPTSLIVAAGAELPAGLDLGEKLAEYEETGD